jgi:hypothetical protein
MRALTVMLSLGLVLSAPAAFGKTVICHVPPDNPAQRQSITVGDAALPAHLAHGDCLGACTVCGCGFTPANIPNIDCVGGTFCQSTAAGCQFFCLGPPACLCGGAPGCCDASPCCEDCPGAGAPECNVSTCSCDPAECCFDTCP